MVLFGRCAAFGQVLGPGRLLIGRERREPPPSRGWEQDAAAPGAAPPRVWAEPAPEDTWTVPPHPGGRADGLPEENADPVTSLRRPRCGRRI
ncbi:hypothetical protein GCM10022416_04290 [Actinomadura keratinilytica]|uniref:Uncharacterized protein n=1 Tax=Actinomadura keratinilytica TaxID=547461 RepID=A0ABP7Y0I0_9ACTN